jgi:succinate-semialdehyde dehydrogenase/glutarate-semialdehyde dehydrogenase
MAIATINPATGQTVKSFPELTDAEVEMCLDRAATTFLTYRDTTFAERAGWMRQAGNILDSEVDDIAVMMTTEMGKTLAAARQEVQKCAKACRYFADHAEGFLADEPADAVAVGATEAFARYLPLGPVLAVMPWNFPLWQVMRFAAPALMAGNVGLLKHASSVPQTALFLDELFTRAGFPPGAFQTLLIGSRKVEGVLRDDRVVAVTLTGSGPAGSSVAAVAGEVVKKSVLELGGSDPFVVMPSADLVRAAEVATVARCLNNGQSCIAAKRFIVHADVADEFETLFVARMSSRVVGDPMADTTDIGPLASEQQRDDIVELVADAVAHGARVLCGGTVPDGPGWFYPPTVLTGITPAMRIHTEEAFAPVATLYRVGTIEEAIELANGTEFGLGANAWTEDEDERKLLVAGLDAGMVFINGNVTSFPELPFGGVKASGYGRELTAHGIREFCNLKSVWVGPSGAG